MEPEDAVATIKTIWLAEDDYDDVEIFEEAIKEFLPHIGLTVFLNGEKLLKELQKSQPDLLFVDVNIPLIDGIKALKTIRTLYSRRQLPIILMSGSLSKKDMEQAYQSGASYYFEKPDTYQQLVQAIEQILKTDWRSEIDQ